MEEIKIPESVELLVISGPDEGKSFLINNKTITIGRQEGCNFELSDKTVSNKHCQLVFRSGHFTVIDLGSLNKTRVNGEVYVQKNLFHEDVISIGQTKIRFLWENQEEWEDASKKENTADLNTESEDVDEPESEE